MGTTWARLALPLVLGVVGGLLTVVTVVAGVATPAYATTATDDTTNDRYALMSDGTPLLVRVLIPTGTRPSGGWPMLLTLHGYGGDRCLNAIYTRAEHVADGYMAISFNGRGMPAFAEPGGDQSALGCTQNEGAADALNDTGQDVGGPNDQQDIRDVITWAEKTYAWTGCSSSTCIMNKLQIGALGYSYGGVRSWSIVLPNEFGGDSRIKAVSPQAGNVTVGSWPQDVTNCTPSCPPDLGSAAFSGALHGSASGWWSRTHADATSNIWAKQRAEYLPAETMGTVNSTGAITADTYALTLSTGTPPFTQDMVGKSITVSGAGPSGHLLVSKVASWTSATAVTLADKATTTVSAKRVSWGPQGWWDARSILAETGASTKTEFDKAQYITTPIFVVDGVLDGHFTALGTARGAAVVEAWKNIPDTTKKYLYLGNCGHAPSTWAPNDCLNSVTARLRAFFAANVKGASNWSVPGMQTNSTADTSTSSTTLTIGGGSLPLFTAYDVGKRILVTGAGTGGETLNTTISAYTNSTTVTMATAACSTCDSPAVAQSATWGSAYSNSNATTTITSPNEKKLTITGAPAFTISDVGKDVSVTLAGPGGTTLNTVIAKWVSGTEVTMADPASSAGSGRTATWNQPCVDAGPCVLYQVPRNNPYVNIDDWPWGESPVWPLPTTRLLAGQTFLYYLHWDKAGTNTGGTLDTVAPSTAAPNTEVASKAYQHVPRNPQMLDMCLRTTVATNDKDEVVAYSTAAATQDVKITKVEADFVLKSSSTRMQAVALLYEVEPDPDGAGPLTETEFPMYASDAFVVPAVRSGYTANTKMNVKFQPMPSMWTLKSGNKLRLKVMGQAPNYYMGEPWKSTYTIYHDPAAGSTDRSTLKIWYGV